MRRWGVRSGTWSSATTTPCDDDVRLLHAKLTEALPPQSRTAIVHGDYRIDNTILDAEDATKVVAVLDWEMSTLGDPLSDAALMCVYRHPTFHLVHADAAWASELIPPADVLAEKYSRAAGQALDHWDFYMALAYFKLAIIGGGHRLPGPGGRRHRRHRQGGRGRRSADRRRVDRAFLTFRP